MKDEHFTLPSDIDPKKIVKTLTEAGIFSELTAKGFTVNGQRITYAEINGDITIEATIEMLHYGKELQIKERLRKIQ